MIADSITKEVGDFALARVLSYSGCTVQRLLDKVERGLIMLEGFKCIIIHIGTNNFGSVVEWRKYKEMKHGKITVVEYEKFLDLDNPLDCNLQLDRFMESYSKLIVCIRERFPDVWIFCSAIIPRPWDHTRRDGMRRVFNDEIAKLCKGRRLLYLKTFLMFYSDLSKNVLKEWYYGTDGLHVSQFGAKALRAFFRDEVHKVVNGLIRDRD